MGCASSTNLIDQTYPGEGNAYRQHPKFSLAFGGCHFQYPGHGPRIGLLFLLVEESGVRLVAKSDVPALMKNDKAQCGEEKIVRQTVFCREVGGGIRIGREVNPG